MLLGVFPKPVLDRITPSVNRLVVRVDQTTNTPVPTGLLPPGTVAVHRPVGDYGPQGVVAAPLPGTRATGGSK